MKFESVNAKKLHESRKFSYERIEEYNKQFIDNTTGKIHEKYLTSRNCPVCDDSNHRIIFIKSGGTYVKCETCSMVFLNPVFTESALKEYYINRNVGQAEIVSNESDFYREIYSLGLSKINTITKPGKILDIGCSSGFFLDIAREKKWQTFGLELGKMEGQICKEKGHELFTNVIEELVTDEKFNAVTMWDVFEHISDSKKMLKTITRFLKPNGLIFLQTPNSGSLAARILKEKCNMFDGIGHVNLFNPTTIKQISNYCGFNLVHISTVISEIAVINNYLDYNDPYFGTSKYEPDKLLGVIDSKLIYNKLLGYKIQAILQQK